MVAVLGIGLYWFCSVLTGGLLWIGVLAAFNAEGYVGNERVVVAGTILLTMFVVWALGRVCRYLLSGY